MKPVTSALWAVCVAVWVSIEALTAAGSCESLSALKLPDTTITMAQSVAAGGFSPPAPGGGGQAFSTLPAFCRVAATIKPTSDSDIIKVEVWLPASGWNGKYITAGKVTRTRPLCPHPQVARYKVERVRPLSTAAVAHPRHHVET